MMNKDINVNSNEYKNLSKDEKLKIVKHQLEKIFTSSSKQKHTLTVVHKGIKKQVAQNKLGLYKDLIKREKALQEEIDTDTSSNPIEEKVLLNIPKDQKTTIDKENMSNNEVTNPLIFSIEEEINTLLQRANEVNLILEKALKIETKDSNDYEELKALLDETPKNLLIFDKKKENNDDITAPLIFDSNKKVEPEEVSPREIKIIKQGDPGYKNETNDEIKEEESKVAKTILGILTPLEYGLTKAYNYSKDKITNLRKKKDDATTASPEDNENIEELNKNKDINNKEEIVAQKENEVLEEKTPKEEIIENKDTSKEEINKEENNPNESKITKVILGILTPLEKGLTKAYNYSKDKITCLKNKKDTNVVDKDVTEDISKTVNEIITEENAKKETEDKVESIVEEQKTEEVVHEKEPKRRRTILALFMPVKRGLTKACNFFKGKINNFKNQKNKTKDNTSLTKNGKKKRRAAALCAILLVLTLIPTCRNNKKNVTFVEKPKETTSQNTDNNIETPEETKPNIDNNNENNNTPNRPNDDDNNNNNEDDNNKEDENISFDDYVTINNNSYIYTNMYDAAGETNALNPYYNNGYERDVQGIAYQLDGKLYIIYETDENALEMQKDLEEAGAIPVAVLVSRTDMTNNGEYEGYYNINSVKVKTRVK